MLMTFLQSSCPWESLSGSSTVHHVSLANDTEKVGVEEIWDVDACVPILTNEV